MCPAIACTETPSQPAEDQFARGSFKRLLFRTLLVEQSLQSFSMRNQSWPEGLQLSHGPESGKLLSRHLDRRLLSYP